jgi:Protein of unknown function (DUF3105)
VQAPRQRATKREGLSDERRRYLILGFGASGLIALAIVASVLATRGGGPNDKGVIDALRAGGCTYKVYPATSQQHVGSLTAKVKWNSDPPSNGPHYSQPALWGNYNDPVAQVQAVHNLEHGGMLIEYGSTVPRATIESISRFYDESPNGMLVFRYPKLKKKIALVAWTADEDRIEGRSATGGYHGEGRVAICNGFNEKAFDLFRDRFRAKGPERFPLDAMSPDQ